MRKEREAELRDLWLALTPEQKAEHVRAATQAERERRKQDQYLRNSRNLRSVSSGARRVSIWRSMSTWSWWASVSAL
jgi:RPA family protein